MTNKDMHVETAIRTIKNYCKEQGTTCKNCCIRNFCYSYFFKEVEPCRWDVEELNTKNDN